MTGVPRFDCYPGDFLHGIIGLTADQIAVYVVVVFLQYDRGGPVQVEGRERELAVRAGMTRGRLTRALSELHNLGKLSREGGSVFNERAAQELEKIAQIYAKNASNSKKGGEATRRKFVGKAPEIKEPDGPTGGPTGGPKQGLLHPPSSILHPPDKITAAAACDSPPPPQDEVFDRHDFLRRCEEASGFIGLRNFEAITGLVDRGTDPERILAVMRQRGPEARRQPDPPVSWAWFLPAIGDPACGGLKARVATPLEFAAEGSPEWAMLIASGKKESLLRAITVKGPDGRVGVWFDGSVYPPEYRARLAKREVA